MAFALSAVFRGWASQLRLPWLDAIGKAMVGAFAQIVGDSSIDWASAAITEQLPEFASATAVSLIASERQVDAGATETTAALATRLTLAVQARQRSGTAMALLNALYSAGYTGAVILQQNGLGFQLLSAPNIADFQLTTQPPWLQVVPLGTTPVSIPGPGGMTAGASWCLFDLSFARCSRFAVLFPAPGFSPFSSGDLARLRSIISTWRPARALVVGIFGVTQGQSIGWPVRNIGTGGTIGPSAVTVYTP